MRYNLCLLLFFLLSCPLAAQQKHFLSLDGLFRLGTENSLRLQAARMQEVIAADQEKTARMARYPDINVGLAAGYIGRPTIFKQGLSDPVHPDVPDWSHNYDVEVIQPIYQGGKIGYNLKRASLEKQIAALNTENDEAEVKMLLLRQYMDLFSLYKQQEVLSRNIEESNRRLADIRRMKKEGLVTRNDELRSELQLTNDQLACREADDNILIVSQQLDVVLGLDETWLLQPDTAILYETASLKGYDEYVQQAYGNYPGLKIAGYNKQVAQNDMQYSKAGYLPSVSIRGANALSRPLSSTLEDVFNNNWNIGLSVFYNLSSLYRNRHNVHQAQQNVFYRENVEEQVRQNIRISVRSAYIRHNEAVDRVKALVLAVQQANENYRIVHNRYMNQLSILTDLLDASRVRLEAELQLTTARSTAVYSYYQLLRACGNL